MKPRIAFFFALACAMALSACTPDDCPAAFKREDYTVAYRLCLPLAEQGDPTAQNILGSMYGSGDGVALDYVEGYKWIILSAAQGDEIANQWLSLLGQVMSPEQIAEAQKLAAEWRKVH